MAQQTDGSIKDSRIAHATVTSSRTEDQKHSQNQEQRNLLT